MPALLLDVPFLVLLKRGDVLSVCFNTVAILFLLDVDNPIFELISPEWLRARVTEAGGVVLSDAEAAAIARTKPVHTFCIMMAVLLGLALAPSSCTTRKPPTFFCSRSGSRLHTPSGLGVWWSRSVRGAVGRRGARPSARPLAQPCSGASQSFCPSR